MKRMLLMMLFAAVALVLAVSVFLTSVSAGGRFESFNTIALDLARMNEVAEGARIDDWPRSNSLRLAPHISKDMLVNPSAVTRESIDYSTERFKDSA
ncbi:MAG: hypothetical protein MUO54_12555, partial [Anaerolineales bacterium]|nr:hypothetical protein [Anaerolineales bacterium]